MKKLSTIACLLVCFFLESCKKYDDPGFSILGPETRLNGIWLLDEAYINDVDSTEHVRNFYHLCRFLFDSDVSETVLVIRDCAQDTFICSSTYSFVNKNKTLVLGCSEESSLFANGGNRFEVNRLSYHKRVWITSFNGGKKLHLRLRWLGSV